MQTFLDAMPMAKEKMIAAWQRRTPKSDRSIRHCLSDRVSANTIELQQRLWPEFALRKGRVDRPANPWIADIDKAPDVTGVIADDLCVGFEDVHA
jgi:hypothetical protein